MRSLILVATLLLPVASAAQDSFPASELSFESIFATRDDDQNTIYSLLGAGFFRAPRSGQEDSLIVAWLAKHPEAVVTPVSTMGPTMQDGTGEMIYVWLTDGADTLNVHLIRHGAFPGGVMEDHLAVAQHMEEIEVPFEDSASIQRFVSDAEYEAFIAQVVAAEEQAASEELGLWSENASQGR
ncbi:MAG: hypothetical protein AAFN13_11725 [Bacteroidota bacterium]